ncbi:MAG: KH domain-containing protein [Desulfoplanes sp.]|nr:KH domain-containing protein [Desulfoplanes sp.]
MAKPVSEVKPVPEAKSVSEAKPVSEAKSVSVAKPAAKNGNRQGSKPAGKNGARPAAKPRNSRQNGKSAARPASANVPAMAQQRGVAVQETPAPSKNPIPSVKREDTPRPAPDFSVDEAREYIEQSMKVLLTNIADECAIRVDMQMVPLEVVIDDDANSGLIIGRDGQTISALQYILNRIVSRKFPGIARIQLDAGDYREKQDEQLRKTALFLSQKAKTSHRTQSTRPLSSYHRRVVHMTLQEDQEVQTRSKGDGPMKRVLVMPRRKKNGGDTSTQAPLAKPLQESNGTVDQTETQSGS